MNKQLRSPQLQSIPRNCILRQMLCSQIAGGFPPALKSFLLHYTVLYLPSLCKSQRFPLQLLNLSHFNATTCQCLKSRLQIAWDGKCTQEATSGFNFHLQYCLLQQDSCKRHSSIIGTALGIPGSRLPCRHVLIKEFYKTAIFSLRALGIPINQGMLNIRVFYLRSVVLEA